MNRTITARIEWSKKSDGQPGMRCREVTVEIPVRGETTAVQDALLGITHTGACSFVVPIVAGVSDTEPSDDAVIVLIQKYVAGDKLKEDKRKKEELERKLGIIKLAKTVRWPWLYRLGVKPLPPPTEFLDLDLGLENCYEKELRVYEEAEARKIARRKEKDAENSRTEEQRKKEISEFANLKGSSRLCKQLAAGLDAWPLYLHERLESDVPGAELDNDGVDEVVVNPTEAELDQLNVFALAVENSGTYPTREIALQHCEIKRMSFDHSEPPVNAVYVVCSGYRPGSAVFSKYTIRVRVS